MHDPLPKKLTIWQTAGCCFASLLLVSVIPVAWLFAWGHTMDFSNAHSEEAMSGQGKFSDDALIQNFNTHQVDFEILRKMLMRDAEKYGYISAEGENGELPISITLGSNDRIAVNLLQRTYVTTLKNIGVTRVFVRKGDKDLDLLVASWGLSVAGGSLSYVYCEKPPNGVAGESNVTTFVPLGNGWYLRDEGH